MMCSQLICSEILPVFYFTGCLFAWMLFSDCAARPWPQYDGECSVFKQW